MALVALKFVATVALLGALIVGCVSAAGPNPVKLFNDLQAMAEKIESVEFLLKEKTPSFLKQRRDLIYAFARHAKSLPSEAYFDHLSKVADEYRLKAIQFVDENRRDNKGNWMSNIFRFGGPLGGMRNLAKNEHYLSELTDRYTRQVKDGLIDDNEVHCDHFKFQTKILHGIMFVIQTDIKTLLVEDQQVLNQAIYEQLKADKFVSSNNFYEIHELNPTQKELLLNFYADRVNHDEISVGQALDHFSKPSEYILGRLIDSCQAAIKFEVELKDVLLGYEEACPKTKADPKGKLFPHQYKSDKFDYVFNFCQNFLGAL